MDQSKSQSPQHSANSDEIEESQHIFDEDDPSLLMRAEVHQGSRPGDTRVRILRPNQHMFRRLDAGLLEATAAADQPRTKLERAATSIKRLLIGTPLATARQEHERLTKFKALAVLSSDAISSVAYATEAILLTLVAAGSQSLGYTLYISFAIVGLLCIVALSYRQTIPAYPNGGGSYIVAKDNLGTIPGLTAAASLMIDYILTVAVSISSGVLALATLFPMLQPYVVHIDIALVLIITVVNLRGIRESGSIFSIPTYVFIFSAIFLIIVGLFQAFVVKHQPLIGTFPAQKAVLPLGIFLILQSFAAGCTAMTGVEAISNGIPAFKKPETHNAAITLTWMAVILGVLFIGIGVLAVSFGIEANAQGNPTVTGQIAMRVFGTHGPLSFMFPVFQLSTLCVLALAANTSYSDFPRLSSLLARDHFLPHQFAFRGDRLAFSTGIVALAVLAITLLIVFKGDTTALLSLYAVGVFVSFTLSQSGMVRHWWKLRKEHKGWLHSLLINGLGAATTLLVAGVIAYTKFLEGAWVVVLLIPLLILMFLAIHHHYIHVEHERTTEISIHPEDIHHRLIVPIASLNQAAQQSMAYARSISSHVTAVHVNMDQQQAEALQAQWATWQESLTEDERIQLDIIPPKRRSIVNSLLDYIDTMHQHHPKETLTVIIPEMIGPSRFTYFLKHPKTFRLKTALLFKPEIIVTNVSWYRRTNPTPTRPQDIRHRIIVPISELDRASVQSLAYARSISPHVIAVHVAIDPHDVKVIREKWHLLQKRIAKQEETHLVIIESPFRSLARPLLAYIDTIRELHPEETLTVILPEFVVSHWWEFPLHNQTAFQLKTAFLAQPRLVVTDIPQHLRKPHAKAGQTSA